MNDNSYHVNGDLVPAEEAMVSVRDRGFQYGDGAFETMRVYNGTPFEWEAHINRLKRTCEQLGFAASVPSPAELRHRVDETLAANSVTEASVKLSITRGVQPGKVTPDSTVDPTIVIQASELPRGGLTGSRVWDDHAKVKIVDTRRVPEAAIPSGMKTHNYLNGILARLELRGTEFDEGLLLSPAGNLTEGATTNLFFVQDGILKTPSADLPLLPGITRRTVRELATEADIPSEAGEYTPDRLLEADEIFLTNSTWEIRPVSQIGEIAVGSGPVTNQLQDLYDERVEALY